MSVPEDRDHVTTKAPGSPWGGGELSQSKAEQQESSDPYLDPSALLDALDDLRRSYKQVAGAVESIAALRALGNEEALIEMALFAQSHEQTVEIVWQALAECEEEARRLGAETSRTEPAPTRQKGPARRDISGTYRIPSHVVSAILEGNDARGASIESRQAVEPVQDWAEPRVGEEEVDEQGIPITQVDVETVSRVLVVDDEPAVLRAFQRVLSQRYDVLTARDGAEALRVVLAEDGIEAIICDLDMPKLDGGGFFAELAELKPQLLQRVAFCTGTTPTNKGERLLKGLQAPVLHKPVAASALLSVVDSVRAR